MTTMTMTALLFIKRMCQVLPRSTALLTLSNSVLTTAQQLGGRSHCSILQIGKRHARALPKVHLDQGCGWLPPQPWPCLAHASCPSGTQLALRTPTVVTRDQAGATTIVATPLPGLPC